LNRSSKSVKNEFLPQLEAVYKTKLDINRKQFQAQIQKQLNTQNDEVKKQLQAQETKFAKIIVSMKNAIKEELGKNFGTLLYRLENKISQLQLDDKEEKVEIKTDIEELKKIIANLSKLQEE